MLSAEVGQPVPAEDAFHAYDQVVKIGKDQFEKQLRIGFDVFVNFDLAPVADNADVHFSGVQIDSTVMFVLSGVESHGLASFG